MNFTDGFVADNEGKTLGFPDGKYVGECLSLVKIYIQERYNIYPPASGCNAARCYWSNFPNPLGNVLKKIPNTPDLIPLKGWIVVWNKAVGDGYGHIAIVLDANITSFTSFDQNWGGRHAHSVVHDYNAVDGFLVPINESEGNDMVEVPNADFEELVRKATEYDQFVEAGYSSINDVKTLEIKIEELKKHECPIIPEVEPTSKLRLKERIEESVEDNVKIIKKYAV